MELEKLFCDVDDFCKDFEKKWQQELLPTSERKRNKKFNLCLSEVMTIIIYFHQSSYRNFKDYYNKHVCNYFQTSFPQLVSYNRFVELKKSALIPLCWYLHLRRGHSCGISFIDSTSLEICLNQRAKRNRVFKDLANWGKSSLGWYFGFKLHLIINEFGEILSFMITPANVDDRKPVPEMTKNLFGKLFGDRGYISHQLFELLFQKNLQLITTIKKNMKNRLIPLVDKILLRKRSLIETVNDQLKNISRRTQFMKRIVEFSQSHELNIRLAYYPPYHSKYNPIERTWAVLENHWKGSILDEVETALYFAKTMTWNGKHPVVKLVTQTYSTGVRLTKKAMQEIENKIERLTNFTQENLPNLGKWFLDICYEVT